ncbi:integrase core domain-containing protein, partial [Massilia aquatica]|uniref:integrase core domain-containing protein n=1 Tax=Massilia aquatica TaxID=2609000 RepID=UPI001E2DB780
SFEPLPASGWDRMSSAFLLPCITPQMVDFPPIEVSEQIRPQQAVRNKRPAPGLIHHSDRGSQYCAHDYQKLVKQFGMQSSMSRRGNCYDNAPMESFWGSLKNELVHHQRYATRADAKAAIQEYIESFYNRQRRHSRLGNVPPALFAENFSKQR